MASFNWRDWAKAGMQAGVKAEGEREAVDELEASEDAPSGPSSSSSPPAAAADLRKPTVDSAWGGWGFIESIAMRLA